MGDVILDPFGGTGVTAIEAFLLGRKAIQNDLNPFANFIARNIADTTLTSTVPLQNAFERIRNACEKGVNEIEKEEAAARRFYFLPTAAGLGSSLLPLQACHASWGDL